MLVQQKTQDTRAISKGSIRAVVGGGSVSGLLAARVLAPYCLSIHIVDKDDLLAPPSLSFQEISDHSNMKWRQGVPQLCQPHQLTAGGARALNSLLPGFHDDMVSLGAIDLDLGKHVYYFDYNDTYPRLKSNLRGLGISRPFLEQSMRKRVYEDLGSKLSIVHDTVEDFELREDRVSGVFLRQGGFLSCDIYIDATGRSSVLPKLMKKHGLKQPEKQYVDAQVKSASRLVKIPRNFAEEWKLLVIKSLPYGTQGGSLLPMEGNIWQVTLADAGGENIPLTDEGFLSFAESLPDQKLFEILKESVPLTPIQKYHAMRNERIMYNHAPLPSGILPLGDSVQRLNPIYGQGITVAAKSAIVLSNSLKKSLKNGDSNIEIKTLSKIFIHDLFRDLENSWKMATASDLRFPKTVCSDPKDNSISYFETMVTQNLLNQAQTDPTLYLKLLEVAHFVRPAGTLATDPHVLTSIAKNILNSYKNT